MKILFSYRTLEERERFEEHLRNLVPSYTFKPVGRAQVAGPLIPGHSYAHVTIPQPSMDTKILDLKRQGHTFVELQRGRVAWLIAGDQ